jgi:hypothetical protein
MGLDLDKLASELNDPFLNDADQFRHEHSAALELEPSESRDPIAEPIF